MNGSTTPMPTEMKAMLSIMVKKVFTAISQYCFELEVC